MLILHWSYPNSGIRYASISDSSKVESLGLFNVSFWITVASILTAKCHVTSVSFGIRWIAVRSYLVGIIWWSVCDPVVFTHLQCGLEPRNLDGTSSAKESSYFHVYGSHLYVSLAWSFLFSLLWPTLLSCSGLASVTAIIVWIPIIVVLLTIITFTFWKPYVPVAFLP